MATRANTHVALSLNTFMVSWAGLLQGDDGTPVELLEYADMTVQVVGTFGGATVAFQGGNTGSHWNPLTDPQGNAISVTTQAIELIMERPRYMRPVVTGGDGTTNLAVHVLLRSQR